MEPRPERACVTHRPPTDGHPWRLADPGYMTCHTCHARLRDLLDAATHDRDGRPDSIPGLYAALTPLPARGSTGRRGPGFGSRSPASDHVIAMRDPRSTHLGAGDPHSVPGVLVAWCQLVAEERDVAALRCRVPDLCIFLSAHLDWLGRQPWVDELDTELRELRAQLRQACGDVHRTVGTCPTLTDDGECGAPLRAPLRGDAIQCGQCRRVWTRGEWMRLGHLLEAS